MTGPAVRCRRRAVGRVSGRSPGRAAAVAAAAIALLAGCSGATAGSQGADDSGAVAADATAPFAVDQDFPDPDVLNNGGTYYAYATNGNGFNVQVATSPDLETWEVLGTDALPILPSWSTPGRTWAPEVTEVSPGAFVMYLTATATAAQAQCIGVATASDPAGPFSPLGDDPIVCPDAQGGAIDASIFRDDDGSLHLLWKNDGNCCGLDTFLQIAPLTAEGTALAGDSVRLLRQDLPWEGNLIEAPTLVKHDDAYVLFYSANDYGGDKYATGYATSPTLLGEYTKAREPVLTTETSGGRYLGPGGQDIVEAPDGSDAIVFHSWDELYIQRGMNVAPLTWNDGVPSVTVPGPR